MAINSILHGISNKLSPEQAAFLEEPFTELEIKQALFGLSGDKAPGPDGLYSFFYQKNWSTLGKYFTRPMLQILNHQEDISLINEMIIFLIPKKKNPKLGLSAAIRLHETNGSFPGIQICRGAHPLSHLLFADDSMLFSQVTPHSSDALNAILQLYNRATGQLVNRDKSSILFSPNTSDESQHQFRHALHLTGEGFVNKYVGVPICVGRVTNSIFHYLLQSVSSRLNTWNDKFFSRAGKETLIKVVVQAIPSFAMSCFKVPKSICLKIQSVIARFWWGSLGTNKVHWKNWSAILVSKFFGGLGFRTFSFHNQALLAKQAWRVWTDTGSLLHSILKARYFKHSDLLNAPVGHNSSFTWRSLLWGRQLLKKGLVWKIGVGTNVPLSASNWIPGLPSPTILHPIDPSQAFVSFFINHDTTWNVPKLNHFFPSYQVDSILRIPLDPTMADSLIWGFHPSGLITVKSSYHLASSLASIDAPSSTNPNPFQQWWKKLWSLSVPPKIKHFTWKAFNHILPCALNLSQKKILPHPTCSICSNSTESVTHALMGCPRAKNIWKLSRFKQFYYDYRRIDIKEFHLQALQNISKQNFPIFIALIWHIWNTHNSILLNRYALDHKNSLTGTDFIFKIGHHRVVASHYRLLPGASTPIFAEGQALLQSLLWCLDSQLSPKFIFSDCLNLVYKVNSAWQDHSALSGLVSQIRMLFSNFPEASLHFLPRQFNMDAHGLAKEAIRSREEV
uniref:Reverse transcriptase zinc-binding domain-containing protein n=1 Tax=Cannabis sativa TaxID=3483 RepID=A0A803PUH8_CANSA